LGQKNYQHIARAVFGTPWMIREAEGSVITSIVRGRLSGDHLALDEITARVQAARAQQGPRSGTATAGPVAVIPIYGILAPRMSMMTEMSGGTSVDQIREQMEEALADQSIAAVIGEFDSPGGSVEGIDELATWIRQQRGQKPMVAVVNTMCCSAAYYLAAQFDEIVASQSSITGSIGIFTEQVEYSKANEMDGTTVNIIRAPDAKHDVNDSEPMTDAGRAHLQMLIDDYYGQFVTAVAKGRGVAPQAVRDGYGEGRACEGPGTRGPRRHARQHGSPTRERPGTRCDGAALRDARHGFPRYLSRLQPPGGLRMHDVLVRQLHAQQSRGSGLGAVRCTPRAGLGAGACPRRPRPGACRHACQGRPLAHRE
jgi:signal peptide peptidase SppA